MTSKFFKIFKMIRGFFLKRSRSSKIMKNRIFDLGLLSLTSGEFRGTSSVAEIIILTERHTLVECLSVGISS